jgi:hypothetical protein
MKKNGRNIKMLVTPRRLFGEQTSQQMTAQIIPDYEGPWAIRYLWVQHLDDNESFCKNYFDPSLAKSGLNIRKQTAHLTTEWSAHNKIFIDSGENGDLVWRVKIANLNDNSIDYIEVWKSIEILEKYFGTNLTWDGVSRRNFNEKLFNAGFDIKSWEPYPTISKKKAMSYYNQFFEDWNNKRSQLIINTFWKRALNPL